MELLAWMQRSDFSEHIQCFKLHGNPLNSPHFDAPSTKFVPTGYRRAPNIISHHYKQQLSAKASIIPKISTNQVSIKRLINTISILEQSQMSHAGQIRVRLSSAACLPKNRLLRMRGCCAGPGTEILAKAKFLCQNKATTGY